MCTKAEGCTLTAIIISTQLLPTQEHSCSEGERNTTTDGEFPGFYHCVKTLSFCNHRLSCKTVQMAGKSQCKAVLNISLVMARSKIKHCLNLVSRYLEKSRPDHGPGSPQHGPIWRLWKICTLCRQQEGGGEALWTHPVTQTLPSNRHSLLLSLSWSSSSTFGDQESCCSSSTHIPKFKLLFCASGF